MKKSANGTQNDSSSDGGLLTDENDEASLNDPSSKALKNGDSPILTNLNSTPPAVDPPSTECASS